LLEKQTKDNVFLTIGIPSYNRGKILLENINSQDKEILLLNPTDDLDFVSQKLIAWSANLIAKD